jgi:hypothetical protein
LTSQDGYRPRGLSTRIVTPMASRRVQLLPRVWTLRYIVR